jgi:hypothetical protein
MRKMNAENHVTVASPSFNAAEMTYNSNAFAAALIGVPEVNAVK